MNDNEFLRGKPRGPKGEQLFNLLTKAVTIAAIFFGIWAGTQRFCKLAGYDPGWVGQPFYIARIGNFSYPPVPAFPHLRSGRVHIKKSIIETYGHAK